ncbi:MAG: hypothetical protein DRP63_06225 [Planctomycetota bacterium]|nr:MAG: hypothetical protein DRP63_06225 [Planctomycetota bacterium]
MPAAPPPAAPVVAVPPVPPPPAPPQPPVTPPPIGNCASYGSGGRRYLSCITRVISCSFKDSGLTIRIMS